MANIGAGWERVVLSWADIQPDGPDDFSWLGRTLPREALNAERAARRPRRRPAAVHARMGRRPTTRDPGRSVPRNLDLPDDDPQNYWGRFVYETVRYYSGRIDEWIIWNEPEFKPDDAAGGDTYTWLGTDQQFARLMQVAYLAAKRANPQRHRLVPRHLVLGRPEQRPRRSSTSATCSSSPNDPRARSNNLYHDAVSLNLYRAPDDLVRVSAASSKTSSGKYTVDEPLWLLELNAMPTEDRSIPCAERARRHIRSRRRICRAGRVRRAGVRPGGGQRLPAHRLLSDGRRRPVQTVRRVGRHARRRVRAACGAVAADRCAGVLGIYSARVRAAGSLARALVSLASRSERRC